MNGRTEIPDYRKAKGRQSVYIRSDTRSRALAGRRASLFFHQINSV